MRIPNVPLHCYTKRILWHLGDRIGKTLKVDMNTMGASDSMRTRVERGRFTRLCVEIDLQKKLIPRVICASALFNVEYEGIGLICFVCGRYGHRREACPWKSAASEAVDHQVRRPTQQKLTPESSQAAEDAVFGPWMLAKKPVKVWQQRRGPDSDKKEVLGTRKPPQQKGVVNAASSTFAALADLDRIEERQGAEDNPSGDTMMSEEGGARDLVGHVIDAGNLALASEPVSVNLPKPNEKRTMKETGPN